MRDRLFAAYEELIERDSFLLVKDANERSITHKLAEYLQQGFPGWHVDCEYNRWASNPNNGPRKFLVDLEEQVSSGDTNGTTVFPDIIVHRRGTTENLLVIEAKKVGGRLERDRKKLQLFRSQLDYEYTALVTFPPLRAADTVSAEAHIEFFGADNEQY